MTLELAIANALHEHPAVRLAVIFGSLARGQLRADSDIDLAVAGAHSLTTTEKQALIESLAQASGRPVDLIDLRTADEPILHQALTTGKLVPGSDRELYGELISKMLLDDADFGRYRRRILAERRHAWIGT